MQSIYALHLYQVNAQWLMKLSQRASTNGKIVPDLSQHFAPNKFKLFSWKLELQFPWEKCLDFLRYKLFSYLMTSTWPLAGENLKSAKNAHRTNCLGNWKYAPRHSKTHYNAKEFAI